MPAGYHKGTLPQKKGFISIDKSNIKLLSFKKCEDGSGDWVMRLAETKGRVTKAAIVCNLIDAGFYADFRGLQIKTFRIDGDGFVTETNFMEDIVRN